jgi:hypothetical protein
MKCASLLAFSGTNFTSRNLQPLGDAGTIYPNMRITDNWGILEVKNGALLKPDWRSVIVVAPVNEKNLEGDGWSLELKPGWKLIFGNRKGDFTLSYGM